MPDSHLQNSSPLQRHNISAGCTFREVGCIPVNLPVLFRSSGSKKTSKKCNSGHGRGNDVPQISPAYKNDQPKMWCVRRVTKIAGQKYNTGKCCCIVISLSEAEQYLTFTAEKAVVLFFHARQSATLPEVY